MTVEDHVATVTISSPEVKNGLTAEMGTQLAEACDAIDADRSVGAAVVGGGGRDGARHPDVVPASPPAPGRGALRCASLRSP